MERFWTWAQILACAAYIIFPADLILDPIPVVGTIDDFIAMWHMIRQLQVTGTLSQAA